MNSIDLSLGELLFHQAGMPDAVWSKILKKPPMSAILTRLSPEILNGTKAEIRKSVTDLFQTNLVDILLAGWNKYQDVCESLDASRLKPEDTFLRPLVEHTLKTVQHPYVEIFADNKLVGKIEFEVIVALAINAVTLKIQQGRIVEILTGTCQGSILLGYAREELAKAKTGEIPLPGKIMVAASAQRSNEGSKSNPSMMTAG